MQVLLEPPTPEKPKNACISDEVIMCILSEDMVTKKPPYAVKSNSVVTNHPRHPTFQITWAMSFAVLTVSTTLPKRPEG